MFTAQDAVDLTLMTSVDIRQAKTIREKPHDDRRTNPN